MTFVSNCVTVFHVSCFIILMLHMLAIILFLLFFITYILTCSLTFLFNVRLSHFK